MAFTSRLKESLASPWGGNESYTILLNDKKIKGSPTIVEAVMLTRHGLVLPLFQDDSTRKLIHNKTFSVLLKKYKSSGFDVDEYLQQKS